MQPRPRILVVDDDMPILVLMKNLLKEFGFEAVVASNGSQAIAEAKKARPDLMLIDRNMPGMSGDDVVKAVRMDGVEAFPILILSGEPIDARELQRIGANGAVMKPFDVTVLIGEIRSRLSG
jgi:DNA-binding response OmpR family regulator